VRLVHWTSKFSEAGISGMKNTLVELVEAELELGFEAGVCDPNQPEGGGEVQLRRRKLSVYPWTWALERPDTVNVFSGFIPKCFYELKHTVQIQHGMPEYVLAMALPPNPTNTMSIALNYPILCDATVCWSRREAEFWRALEGVGRVEHINRGVDLAFWRPEGDKVELVFRPQVGFLEAMRAPVKSALTFLFALKLAQRRVKTLRAQFGCIEPNAALVWTMIYTKLNLDLVIENAVVGALAEPWKFYRALDMVVCPVLGGHISRVGVEAMASGCPVIALEGSDDQVSSLKCRDSPESMADAMLKLWDMTQADPKGARGAARRIAEQHYSIVDTAKAFIRLAEDLI